MSKLALYVGATSIVIAPVLSMTTAMTASASSSVHSSARSVASALVADFEAGKFSDICSLTVPTSQSACSTEVTSELKGTHPSFPNVHLSAVSVKGSQATYTLSCTGASYCGNFTGTNLSQAMVEQNGKWYLDYNSANYGNFALSITAGSGGSKSGNGGSTKGPTKFCQLYATDVIGDANGAGGLDFTDLMEMRSLQTDVHGLYKKAPKGAMKKDLKALDAELIKVSKSYGKDTLEATLKQSQVNSILTLTVKADTESVVLCPGITAAEENYGTGPGFFGDNNGAGIGNFTS